MSEKVKLRKHVAESLDHICGDPFNTNLYSRLMTYRNEFQTVSNGIDLDTIMQALVLGYEVEETPEERIKRIFDRSVIEHGDIGCQLDSYTTKILTVEILNILGKKIEGVNA